MKAALLMARWSAVLAWMILLSLFAWKHDPALAAQYPGYWRSLAELALLGGVELLVLVAILRPWSYRWSWGRSLTASVVLVPWWIFVGGLSLHSDQAAAVHFNWLTLVAAACLLLGLVSLSVALLRRRGRGGSLPPSTLPG